MTEKLQKVLARAGLGSRREIETWITAGLVRVNGEVAKLGDRVGARDQLQVRGRKITMQDLIVPETQVLLYNKTESELVTRSDEQGRDTVFASLPKPDAGRWIAVGRLDVNTTGLLLFTNNGELANKLMHPAQAIERAYLVRVFGEVAPDVLAKLTKGVMLDDGMANFDKVEPMLTQDTDSINRWYKVTLLEGRNREVRRLWESQGVRVSRLKRIAFGGITMPKQLRLGKSQLATLEQTNSLLSAVGLPVMTVVERSARKSFSRQFEYEPRNSGAEGVDKRQSRDGAKTSFMVKDGKTQQRPTLTRTTNKAPRGQAPKPTGWQRRYDEDDYID
jgi:23S rRNA pseudouridine2605 synthase